MRFDKNNFFGLPLAILVFALVYALSLFGGVIENIIESDVVVSADIKIANLLLLLRDSSLIKFFLWATLLGKFQVVCVIALIILFILWIKKKRYYIISLLLSLIGSEFFTLAGKIVIKRPRPSAAIYLEETYSFPSSHATIAVAFYGFIFYMLIMGSKPEYKKTCFFLAGLLIIFLLGFSRLYLGVHYLSDVWAGYLIGLIWLVIGIGISESILRKKISA